MNDQGSQGSQDCNAPQQPDIQTPDPAESHTDNPYRADVDRRPLEQRRRKYADNKKLRKRNAQGILQYDVSIVSARFDPNRHSWMYILNDWKNERISGETKETDLG